MAKKNTTSSTGKSFPRDATNRKPFGKLSTDAQAVAADMANQPNPGRTASHDPAGHHEAEQIVVEQTKIAREANRGQ